MVKASGCTLSCAGVAGCEFWAAGHFLRVCWNCPTSPSDGEVAALPFSDPCRVRRKGYPPPLAPFPYRKTGIRTQAFDSRSERLPDQGNLVTTCPVTEVLQDPLKCLQAMPRQRRSMPAPPSLSLPLHRAGHHTFAPSVPRDLHRRQHPSDRTHLTPDRRHYHAAVGACRPQNVRAPTACYSARPITMESHSSPLARRYCWARRPSSTKPHLRYSAIAAAL